MPIAERLIRVLNTQRRVLAQRLAERLPERSVHVDYLGHPFAYPSGSLIGRAIRRGDIWDAPLLASLSHARQGSDFIDIGANIGATSCGVLHHRPDLRLTAVEPSNRFLPFLHKNLATWIPKNAKVVPSLIGPAGGSANLIVSPTTASLVRVELRNQRRASRERVESQSLEDLLTSVPECSMIKIDVDGYEGQLLLSGANSLANQRPVLFLEWFPSLHALSGCSTEEVLNLLQQCGYHEARVFVPSGSPSYLIDLTELRIPPGQYVDLLLVSQT